MHKTAHPKSRPGPLPDGEKIPLSSLPQRLLCLKHTFCVVPKINILNLLTTNGWCRQRPKKTAFLQDFQSPKIGRFSSLREPSRHARPAERSRSHPGRGGRLCDPPAFRTLQISSRPWSRMTPFRSMLRSNAVGCHHVPGHPGATEELRDPAADPFETAAIFAAHQGHGLSFHKLESKLGSESRSREPHADGTD